MPEILARFLGSLNDTDADEIDEWLDGDPGAIEKMRKITYPRTAEGLEQSLDKRKPTKQRRV